jgi:hypothetical protein
MKRMLLIAEWTLLIVFGGQVLLLVAGSFADLFAFSDDWREARKQGTFFPGPPGAQTYFGRSLTVDAVVYDGERLSVYMTGRKFGAGGKLPSPITVTADTGEVLHETGGSRSTNLFFAKGEYRFETRSADIKGIRIHQESYGESFSFTVPLAKGGTP